MSDTENSQQTTERPVKNDRYLVQRDGEELEVYNWCSLVRRHQIFANGSSEEFSPKIGAGDSTMTPEYVTERLADQLWHDHNIEVENEGIEAVDINSDEVTVL